jgi:uncharacterized protein (TIGR03067 family)
MNDETIFHLAREKPPSERAAFLETACAGDAEMRRRVEVLLEADEDAGSFLQTPVNEQLATSAFCAEGEQDAPSSTHCLDGATPQVKSEPTMAETAPPRPEGLAFLAPGTRPGSIGRLGHYEILAVIGKGGFGTVLKAFDEKLHRVVAIKVLSPAYADNGSARKRFIREARTAAAVKNEHVVGIYDVDEKAQPPYLAMEMIEGISLQDKIDKQGPLGIREILRIGMQMAEGLAAAHKQGLVHRDIKPANILLENGVERVKITDFGLARAVDDASVTQSGTVAGTPMFMSPEQAEGLQVDHRSDLFSFGTVLYAMCTGHPPFRASGTHAVLKRVIDASPRPVREINNDIPDWLCDIIGKLHAKKPEDRFQTANEVAELLGQHLAHLQQPNLSPRPPRIPAPRAEDAAEGLGGAATGFALGLVFFLAYFAVFAGAYWILGWDTPTLNRIGTPITVALAIGLWGLGAWAKKVHRLGASRALYSTSAAAFILSVALGVSWLRTAFQGDPSTGSTSITVSADDPDVKVTFFGVGDGATTKIVGRPSDEVSLLPGKYNVFIRCGAGRKIEFVSMADWPQPRTFAGGEDEVQVELKIQGGQHPTLVVKTASISPQSDPKNEQQPEPGWVQLFNGKDLKGWVPQMEDPKDPFAMRAWEVFDKVLIARGTPNGYLRTEKPYQHFVLEMECQPSQANVAPGAVAGDILFQIPVPDPGIEKPSGMRLQWDAGGSGVFVAIGALAPHPPKVPPLFRPDFKAFKPDWNQLRFESTAGRFEIVLNGKSILNVPDYQPQPGYFAIISKGTGMRYRNIRIKELPGAGAGWVQLFNGKDLTGWKRHPDQPNPSWEVVNGILVGKNGPAYLDSVRSDFQSFHLRAEILINKEAEADLCLRSKSSRRLHPAGSRDPAGYVVDINEGRNLYTGPVSFLDPLSNRWTTYGANSVVKPGEWFALEVLASDNHLSTKVNGVTAVDFRGPVDAYQKGHIALRVWKPDTVVKFRKIEIKELTPSAPQAVNDKDRLQGHWVAESVDNGRQLPKDFVALFSITIDSNKVIWRTPPLSPTVSGEQTSRKPSVFHLNETATPKQIDMIDEDRHGQFGIYRFDGDRLVICMGEDAVKDRPKEFSPRGGKSRLVIVFKRRIKADKDRLQGRWVAESIEANVEGNEIKLEPGKTNLGKAFPAFTLTVTGNKITADPVLAYGAKRSGDAIFYLDDKASPKKIDLIDEERKGQFGIYRFDGDRFVLCIGDDGEKDRPTAFSAKGGSKRMLVVFKRDIGKAQSKKPSPPAGSGWVQHFQGTVTGLTVSPNGKLVAVGLQALDAPITDGHALLLDPATGTDFRRLKGPKPAGGVLSVSFSSDGSRLAGSGDRVDNKAYIWDTNTGALVQTLVGHTRKITSIAFLPGDQHLLTTSWDQTLRIWDVKTGKELPLRSDKAPVTWPVAVLLPRGGQQSFFGGGLGGVNVQAIVGGAGKLLLVDISVAAAPPDKSDPHWFLRVVREFAWPGGRLMSLAVSPDEKRLLTDGGDGTDGRVRLWDVSTGKLIRAFDARRPTEYLWFDLCFLPDGKRFLTTGLSASGPAPNELSLWDIDSGKVLRTFKGHTRDVIAIAVTPDGQHALSSGLDKTVRMWNLIDMAKKRGSRDSRELPAR